MNDEEIERVKQLMSSVIQSYPLETNADIDEFLRLFPLSKQEEVAVEKICKNIIKWLKNV